MNSQNIYLLLGITSIDGDDGRTELLQSRARAALLPVDIGSLTSREFRAIDRVGNLVFA